MGPDQRDQQQRRGERPHQRAGGRDRVEPPGDRAGVARRVASASRLAYGATVPEQHHRHRDQHQHRDQRADEARPTDSDPSASTDRSQERVGRERDDRQQRPRPAGRAGTGRAGRARRSASRPPIAVADRQGDEHGRDRVGPDDRRRAEVRRQQPRGRDLGAEAGGADHERDRADRGHRRRLTGAWATGVQVRERMRSRAGFSLAPGCGHACDHPPPGKGPAGASRSSVDDGDHGSAGTLGERPGARGQVRVPCAPDAALQLPGLGQLLQGPAAVRPPRDRVRAPGTRRRRPFQPVRGAGRAQPGATGAHARARRWPRAPRVRRDPVLLRRRDRVPAPGPYERAQVLQWMFFEQYSHEPNIAVARFRQMPGSRCPTRSARPRARRRGGAAGDGGPPRDHRSWSASAIRSPTSRCTPTRTSPPRADSSSSPTRRSGLARRVATQPGHVPITA